MSFSRLQSDPTTQTLRIQTNTDLHRLEEVLDWFNQFDRPEIPRAVWMQCQLALAEGFTNAVRHAHAEQPLETPIEIEARLNAGAIELRIWDYGAGFDLEDCLHGADQPHQEAAGGRGLKIIQQTADVVHYGAADAQRNCLLIVKNY